MSITGLQASAGRIVARYGTTCTLRRFGTSTYDPATGSAAVTTTDYTVTAAIFDPKRLDSGAVRDGNSLVRVQDREAVISAVGLAVVPLVDDVLIDVDGVNWRVTDVQVVQGRGMAIVYDVRIRGNA